MLLNCSKSKHFIGQLLDVESAAQNKSHLYGSAYFWHINAHQIYQVLVGVFIQAPYDPSGFWNVKIRS